MQSQFISQTFRDLLEGETLFAAVMKQQNGEKLEINFYWTSIFMMGITKSTYVAFIRLESAKILSGLESHENLNLY